MRIVFACSTILVTGCLLASDGAVIRGFVRDSSGASLAGVTADAIAKRYLPEGQYSSMIESRRGE
jgi:hypothetical protein